MLRSLKGLYHLLIATISVFWFRFPSRKLTVIGVTGTDGKTTTTTLIYEILKTAGVKTSMISSVHAVIAGKSYDTGFHVTTPSAFWVQKYLRDAVDHGDTHMVLEVTSHGLAQHRVAWVRFAVGVITNVTHEHLDWHKTFDAYLRTKVSLLRRSKIAVVNRDEAELYNRAVPLLRRGKLVTYGIRRDANVTPKTHPFKTLLPGEFNRYNCLAALSATSALDVAHKKAAAAIARFGGVLGRMEVVVVKPFTVIVDFAHTANALDRALKTAKSLAKKRLIHVFGSAGLRDHSKRPFMGRASSRYADIIVLTEEDYRSENVEKIMDQIAMGIANKRRLERFADRGEAIKFALREAEAGDIVIITGKGHEKSLCRGKVEYPWSDQEEVRNALKQMKINHA